MWGSRVSKMKRGCTVNRRLQRKPESAKTIRDRTRENGGPGAYWAAVAPEVQWELCPMRASLATIGVHAPPSSANRRQQKNGEGQRDIW